MKYNPVFEVLDGQITVSLGEETHVAPDEITEQISLELVELRSQRDKLAKELFDEKSERLKDKDKVLKYDIIYKIVDDRVW